MSESGAATAWPSRAALPTQNSVDRPIVSDIPIVGPSSSAGRVGDIGPIDGGSEVGSAGPSLRVIAVSSQNFSLRLWETALAPRVIRSKTKAGLARNVAGSSGLRKTVPERPGGGNLSSVVDLSSRKSSGLTEPHCNWTKVGSAGTLGGAEQGPVAIAQDALLHRTIGGWWATASRVKGEERRLAWVVCPTRRSPSFCTSPGSVQRQQTLEMSCATKTDGRTPGGAMPTAGVFTAAGSAGAISMATDTVMNVKPSRIRKLARSLDNTRDGADRATPAAGYGLGPAVAILSVVFLAAYVLAVSTTPVPFAVAVASLALGTTLVIAGSIDLATFRLPDALTLPLLLAGLGVTALLAPAAWPWHAAGAAAGYATLVAFAWLYRAARGRDGLGRGDAKLLAAGGAWVGIAGLSTVMVIASVAALVYAAVGSSVLGNRFNAVGRYMKIPFGPFLGLGIWIVWLFGPLSM